MIRGEPPPARPFVALAACLLFFLTLITTRAAENTPPLRAQIESAIAKVRPALVRIRVVSADYSDGREIKMQAVGSGVIITKDGYLVTNHHVAGHGRRMFCTLWNRDEIEAELIGTDPLTDISVLKLKPDKPREFAPASFGDVSKVQVGDSVLAMGSPMALSQSVTLGIISNTEMVMPRFWGSRARFRLDGEDVGGLVRWIGHDAPIFGGNSGGPLVNLKGEIIGINEISFGLAGAIPANLAHSIAEQLMAHGKIERSWMGIDVQPLFKHSDEEHGVVISGVLDHSPASQAGLKAGDLLLRIDNTATDVRFDEEMPRFMRLVTSLKIGREVPALIKRDGKEMTVRLSPIERGDAFPAEQEIKPWGVTVRNFSPFLAREMKRENLDGVLVTSVRPGGPAGESKPAINPDDVIVQVNGAPVKNIADLLDLTHKITAGHTEPVPAVAAFERRADRYLTVVKVGVQELEDPGLEVTKAWLPVETQVISRDIARQLGDPNLKGFCVTRVYPGTTAEKAGLNRGDFITAVDDEKLTAASSEYEDELSTLIRQYDIGKTVDLTVLRDKSSLKIPVVLERSPRLRREMKKYRNEDFEFTARDVSFFDAAEQEWDSDQKGALVENVRSGSWAELGNLRPGDLILEVDGTSISNVEQLRQRLEQIATDRKSVVLMKVQRGIHTLYLEMEPNWKT